MKLEIMELESVIIVKLISNNSIHFQTIYATSWALRENPGSEPYIELIGGDVTTSLIYLNSFEIVTLNDNIIRGESAE